MFYSDLKTLSTASHLSWRIESLDPQRDAVWLTIYSIGRVDERDSYIQVTTPELGEILNHSGTVMDFFDGSRRTCCEVMFRESEFLPRALRLKMVRDARTGQGVLYIGRVHITPFIHDTGIYRWNLTDESIPVTREGWFALLEQASCMILQLKLQDDTLHVVDSLFEEIVKQILAKTRKDKSETRTIRLLTTSRLLDYLDRYVEKELVVARVVDLYDDAAWPDYGGLYEKCVKNTSYLLNRVVYSWEKSLSDENATVVDCNYDGVDTVW